jgi:hypothetical protein
MCLDGRSVPIQFVKHIATIVQGVAPNVPTQITGFVPAERGHAYKQCFQLLGLARARGQYGSDFARCLRPAKAPTNYISALKNGISGPKSKSGARSYETVGERLAKAVIEGELDGIILIVPDYIKDIDAIAKRSWVRLTEHGIVSGIINA